MKPNFFLTLSMILVLLASLSSEPVRAAAELDVMITGIHDIRAFLERCPTTDPVYQQIRQDFELRLDSNLITTPITCIEPISALPIAQYTNELIAVQVLRAAYYMSIGTEGHLPWTSKSLYSWMKDNIQGINLKTAPNQLYCCDFINGKYYISMSLQNDATREWKRTWPGFSTTLAYYVHEIRHRDPDDPGHVTGCPAFPSGTYGCDQTYDLHRLGSYGTQYWLNEQWATGVINIGIGCAPELTAQQYAMEMASNANSYIARFVTNPPPQVTAQAPYGGTCIQITPMAYLPMIWR